MADINEINKVNNEISLKWNAINLAGAEKIEKMDADPNFILSAGYDEIKKRIDTLQQELYVLKAKKHSLYHEYSFTLEGDMINTTGGTTHTTNTYSMVSIFDCALGGSRSLDRNNSVHLALLREIQNEYQSYYRNGQFAFINIFQHR